MLSFVLILGFGMSALILGCIQNFDCETVTFPQYSTEMATPGSLDSGPFMYKFSGVLNLYANGTKEEFALKVFEICRPYSSTTEDLKLAGLFDVADSISDIDRELKSVQGMAITACILGSIAMISVCTSPNCGVVCLLQWKIYGIMLFLTSIFQGLSLLIFQTVICLDNPLLKTIEENPNLFGQLRTTFGSKCEMAVGAECGIASTVLWSITGILVCFNGPPGRYKEDWLTHALQASQAQATKLRMVKATRLEEYEQKLTDKRLQQSSVIRVPLAGAGEDLQQQQDVNGRGTETIEESNIFYSTIEENAEVVIE